MDYLPYIIALLFCLLGVLCVASIIVSLPGGWIMLGLGLLIEYGDRFYLAANNQQTFRWWLLGTCAGLLLIGEVLEFAAGAMGVKKSGGSTRGMVGALIGGIGGAVALTPLIPIPIVGTLIGAVIGTFAGAIVGEMTGQNAKSMSGSMKPAPGATAGKLAGTGGKIILTIAVWIALSAAAFIP